MLGIAHSAAIADLEQHLNTIQMFQVYCGRQFLAQTCISMHQCSVSKLTASYVIYLLCFLRHVQLWLRSKAAVNFVASCVALFGCMHTLSAAMYAMLDTDRVNERACYAHPCVVIGGGGDQQPGSLHP